MYPLTRSTSRARFFGLPFSPLALFAAGEQGVWYDPSDFSTLFQNAAGTTPVTAVEQPVRLMLDKSGRGNHALAPSDTARPVLRARYNLLTYSEEFDNAAWNKTLFPVTVTQNAEVAPNGTATADLMLEQATTANHGCYNATAISPTVTGVSYTYSVYAKTAGRSFLIIDAFTNANAYTWFDLSTGQVGTNAAGNTASIISVGNGWYRCSVQRAATATLNHFIGIYAAPSDNTASYAGDVTKGLYIWGADLRVTNDALNQPAYQRVGAASDYDTNGFLPYLEFDQTDDSMSTSAINLTGTDKISAFAGQRLINSSAEQCLFEHGIAGVDTDAIIFSSSSAEQSKYDLLHSGGAATRLETATNLAPRTLVRTAEYDRAGATAADQIKARQNGSSLVSGTSGTAASGGNFNNYPLYIGRRGGTSFPLGGRIYSLIVRGAASSAAEIAATEAWVNARTQAY